MIARVTPYLAVLVALFAALLIDLVVLTGHADAQTGVYQASPATLTNGQRTDALLGPTGEQLIASMPNASALSGIVTVPMTSAEATAGTYQPKGTAGNLYAIQAVGGAAAGYLMLFNATAPADGAVLPRLCIAIPAGANFMTDFTVPEYFSVKIVAVFSSTGCYTKTTASVGFVSADVK